MGGWCPYFTWHDPCGQLPSVIPIVMISPVLKLKDCPDLAFGARRALMQHHPWQDRRYFLDMDDAAVKSYFRSWVHGAGDEDAPVCPLYVLEQYEWEKQAALRGVRWVPTQSRQARPSTEGDANRTALGHCNDDVPDVQWDYDGHAPSSDGGEVELSDDDAELEAEEDTRALKMLCKGNPA